VRGLIKKYGLDIKKIKATGENGRILESDIDSLIKKK
jgi:pyruvate/2-oxoglutarate dehydrogenase complex dihydrolipoamide acyltransferase (E2) component